MKRTALLLTVLLLPACEPTSVNWPGVAACGVSSVAGWLLDAVANALRQPDPKLDGDRMRGLAKAHGSQAVQCAASAVAESLGTPPPGVSASEVSAEDAAVKARAEAWLASVAE